MFPAGRGPTSLFDRLRDPQLYAAAAERVRARQIDADRVRPLAAGGPYLQGFQDTAALAQRLARMVSRGEYRCEALVPRAALIRGKQRTLYVASPLDEIVLGALAEALGETLEGHLSERVFSYRRGRSALGAVEQLLCYLRAHKRACPERRQQGLYVLRRDVRGYGEAIASGPGSRLWPLVQDAAAASGEQLEFLRAAFRPPVREASGSLVLPERGIPTGSPLQPAACNLYLTPVDRLLEAVPDGFYARYGDDMLFAHPDPELVRDFARALDSEIEALDLHWSADKCATLYWNAAGRRAPPRAAEFASAVALEYLGFRVDFRGVIGLKREKSRSLLRDIAGRLERSARLLSGEAAEQRARDLCGVVNAALDPSHPAATLSASALRHLVSDRAQLRDLDHKLALLVARELSGRRGVRAFRAHPPRRLRAELGLVSLEHTRNSSGRTHG
ncbi:MAG TPA: reverse transcriptase domain-containing protein [Polyangiales bacterium]|nr:reverse transcriptase domain-containing protein [Polyangiales bacterium]